MRGKKISYIRRKLENARCQVLFSVRINKSNHGSYIIIMSILLFVHVTNDTLIIALSPFCMIYFYSYISWWLLSASGAATGIFLSPTSNYYSCDVNNIFFQHSNEKDAKTQNIPLLHSRCIDSSCWSLGLSIRAAKWCYTKRYHTLSLYVYFEVLIMCYCKTM